MRISEGERTNKRIEIATQIALDQLKNTKAYDISHQSGRINLAQHSVWLADSIISEAEGEE